MSIQPVITQATHALQHGRFEAAKTLVSGALEAIERPEERVPLLEVLAQAHAGLQEHGHTAATWQRAYVHAATPADKARLFDRARQAYQEQQDYAALLSLAQEHLPHTRTPQERALCLLVAGEALVNLQRYQEARQHYLEPALTLDSTTPETRLHVYHYLGLSYLDEHAFGAAAAAFRQSADLALGRHFTSGSPHVTVTPAQLHHLRNAAHFYVGAIHLLYQRPSQALQAFQELQRPLTAVGTLNVALFSALAYRQLHQPAAAARSLQALVRTSSGVDALRGPGEIVRAGMANLGETLAVVGEHLEAALDTSLTARTAWEPTWQALFYEELGLAFSHTGCRAATIACYEQALHLLVQRTGLDPEPPAHDDLRGAAFLTVLERLPLETCSVGLQGEMRRVLQELAWLYNAAQERALADTALALALRCATAPEQEAGLWLHRGWSRATLPDARAQDEAVSPLPPAEFLRELEARRARHGDTATGQALRGVMALLQGDEVQAVACFAETPVASDVPECQAFRVAAWLWAQARQDTLEQTLSQMTATTPPPWHTSTTLAQALEALLLWQALGPTSLPLLPVLVPLLRHQRSQTLAALRLLNHPEVLPEALHAALVMTLTQLCHDPAHTALADQIVEILPGPALVARTEAALADLEHHLAASPGSTVPEARPRKLSPRRGSPPVDTVAGEAARALQLIALLHPTREAATSALPEVIYQWLVRYPHLRTHTPEVVGALLGILRQCPQAHAVMQRLVEQVPLSRRQRQALEAVLAAPSALTAPGASEVGTWEAMRHWSLGQLLEALGGVNRGSAASHDHATASRWYMIALIFTRVGLPSRAVECFQTCVRLQPAHPLAHYQLAQLCRQQHQHEAALQHTLQTWQALQTMAVPTQLLHLEVLNQLLALLATTHQYAHFPEWLQAFVQRCTELEAVPLDATQQQRRRVEKGEFALARALYLAALPPSHDSAGNTPEQQLTCLAQAVELGRPATQRVALHRQAALLWHLYRDEAAVAAYTHLLERWPDDQQARVWLALCTALRHDPPEPTDLDPLLAEALALALEGVESLPAALTPQSALQWLQQASRHDPHMPALVDVLTLYGGVALQHGDPAQTIALLTPVYPVAAQPRQAYYLAKAHSLRSQQARLMTEQLQESERALQYLHEALTHDPAMSQVAELLQPLQEQHNILMMARQQEEVLSVYRQRICDLFTQVGVPYQAEVTSQAPGAPWVQLQEVVDVNETNGELMTTVKLCFNGNATGAQPVPSEQDVTLYAQHQRDKHRAAQTHGLEALPWPHTAYEGKTDFALIFPERLTLNRDLLFLAFADLHALMRYARVLRDIVHTLPTPQRTAGAPSMPALAAAARCMTLVPLVRQRLQTLASTAPSKALQHQMHDLRAALTVPPLLEWFQTFPVFTDAYAYFRVLAEAMRPHLDTPPTEHLTVQHEERQPPRRPVRHRRRSGRARGRDEHEGYVDAV